jgi:ADP-ribose pyrophosphatase
MATPDVEEPEVIATEEVYHGRVFDITVETIREGGETYKREIVHHPGSAVIIPVFDDGTVALVRQYRHPAVRYLLEAPAGTLSTPERPEDGAARELEEEIGFRAGRLEKLTEFFVSPGFLEEKMWVYLATEMVETAQKLDDDEYLKIVRLPLTRALEMITDGEIEDAKTMIGLWLAAQRLGVSAPEYPAV